MGDQELPVVQQPHHSEKEECHQSDGAMAALNTPKEAPVRSVHGWKWFLACTVIYISVFVHGLDSTIAADVQSAVIEDFHTVQSLAWLGAGFLMASVATIFPASILYKRFNNKYIFIAGVALFEVGSAVCGSAPSMPALIVGRVLAGIGGSGLYLGSLNLLTSLTTDKERGGYISATGFFWGTGAIIGPVVGGAFSSSSATWRWAFYINLVIAAVCAPVFFLYVPSVHPSSGQSINSRLATMDVVGAMLNISCWVLFVLVLTFGGSTWSWKSGQTIAVWVLLGTFLIAYGLQQRYAIFTAKTNRIFPAKLLLSRTQLLLYFGTAASACSCFVPIWYIPLYFQFVHGDTAIVAAVRLLPFVAVSFGFNLLVGAFLPRIRYYAALYVVAGIFIVAGGAALYTINTGTPIANVYGYIILIAFGAGATVQSGYSLAAIKLVRQGRPTEAGSAIALQNVAQIGTGAIVLSISGAIFQNIAFQNLEAVLVNRGYSASQIRDVIAGTQSEAFESFNVALRAQVVTAITNAMKNVFILVPVGGAVSALSGFAMRWEVLFE